MLNLNKLLNLLIAQNGVHPALLFEVICSVFITPELEASGLSVTCCTNNKYCIIQLNHALNCTYPSISYFMTYSTSYGQSHQHLDPVNVCVNVCNG